MSLYAVVFASRANRQLENLYDYAALSSGEARARSFVGKIVAACQALSTFPERGRKRDDIRVGLRLVGFESVATIAFSVDAVKRVVVILGVFYRGQNFEGSLRASKGGG